MQQQILNEKRSNPRRAQSRGISDELIKDLARSSPIPIDEVRAIADWTLITLKDELKKNDVKFLPDTIKPELLNMMTHALTLERKNNGLSRTISIIGGNER